MPTFALNFPRPGAQVLLQYFQFLRLGREGYREVHQASQDVAKFLAGRIGAMRPFDLWNDGSDIPVFAWRLASGHTGAWTLYDLSDRLRERGWLVPAYPMPDNLADVTVQRVVVRNGLSMDLAGRLLHDIETSVHYLDQLGEPLPATRKSSFHH
jgi:glutamate decarboxylase